MTTSFHRKELLVKPTDERTCRMTGGSQEEMEAVTRQLSAEAAEFVPTQDPSILPRYMFNCYPFVNESASQKNGSKSTVSASGAQGPRLARPNQMSRKQGMIAANGSVYPPGGGQHFYPVVPPRPGGVFGQPGYYQPPRCPNATALPLHAFPPTSHMIYNNYMPPVHASAPPRPPARPHSNTRRSHGSQSSEGSSGWQGTTTHRKRQKQTSNADRKSKISVGTQNEIGSKQSSNRSTGASRSSIRTIILVDTAAQTDFSSEIADQTLEQIPNALYQGKRKVRRKTLPSRQQNGGDDSTESEELDHSDSGYSSPLHRQNQTSSGTDARAKASDATQTAINTTVSQANSSCSVKQTSNVYHTAALYHEPGHLAHLPHNNTNNMSYASAVATQQPVLPAPKPSAGAHNSSIAQQNGANSEQEEGGDEAVGSKKKRRKRGRRRKRKDKTAADDNVEGGCPSESMSFAPSNSHDQFQSPILSQESPFDLLAPENFPSFAEAALYDDSAECKLSGKRKKRREQANKAAMEEQLEIDLEQQALKVVNQTAVIVKPIPLAVTAAAPSSAKKSQQPVSINIMDMISSTTPKKVVQPEAEVLPAASPVKKSASLGPKSVLNPLDSTAPAVKRGKERETPKAKKPSALKKVILKEREERKRLRYIGDGPVDLISTPDSSLHFTSEPEENDEDDVISDLEDPNSLGNSIGDDSGTPHSQDLSPVSQNSPISVGLLSPPTSLSNPASGVGSPTVVHDIIQKIHSRRFREYCKQVLDKEIDVNCTNLLQTLVKFQDRLYHKDPIKAKTKRRLVLGLREVTKHLKLRRVKLVIISPNLEKIQSKGGLDDALNMIINLCREQDVPFVFALGRRSLGRACAKLVPVSVVGVFNYQGAETMYHELIDLTSQAREAYHEMVDALAKEVAEYGGALKGSCGLYFSHLGHSRTPSGCSAISFTSSILSEPVSDACVKTDLSVAFNKPSTSEHASSLSSVPTSTSSSVNEVRGPLQDDIYDIDEGNEADTEDNDAANHSSVSQAEVVTAQGETTSQPVDQALANSSDTKVYLNNNNDKAGEMIRDYQKDVTPESADTISQMLTQMTLKKRSSHDSHRHSRSNSGSHIEVKSQASSRTLDQHDAVSTHSSVTIENASETEPISDSLGSSSSSCRIERIKSWVRDVDATSTASTEISQDDAEFNATYTACEANTDVLISRSRSPSVSKS